MNTLITFIKMIAVQWLVLVIGLIYIKRMPDYLKLLLLQVFISVLNYHVVKLKAVISVGFNPVINSIYAFIETIIIIAAAGLIYKNKKFHKILILSASLAFLAFILNIITQDFFLFANYAYCFYGLIIISIYLYILFIRINQQNKTKLLDPVTLIIIGVIVYYACLTPYMAMYKYLLNNQEETSSFLFYYVLMPLSNLRYLLMGMAMIIVANKKKPGKNQQLVA